MNIEELFRKIGGRYDRMPGSTKEGKALYVVTSPTGQVFTHQGKQFTFGKFVKVYPEGMSDWEATFAFIAKIAGKK
jgi:hypothetical protein